MTDRFHYFIALLLVIFNGCLQAQEGSTRTLRYYIFAESDTAASARQDTAEDTAVPNLNFSYIKDGEISSVEVPASGLQGPFEARITGNKLYLFDPAVTALENLTPADYYAALDIPPTWRDVMIYGFSSRNDTKPRFLALADIKELNETGESFCLNITGKPIAVNIGDKRFMLEKHGRDTFKLGQGSGAELVQIKVAAEWQESWKLALNTSRRLAKGQSYMFLFKGMPSNPRAMVLRVAKLPNVEVFNQEEAPTETPTSSDDLGI